MVNGVVVVKVRRLTDASVVALMAAHPGRVILRPQDRLVCVTTSKSCTTKLHHRLNVAYAK